MSLAFPRSARLLLPALALAGCGGGLEGDQLPVCEPVVESCARGQRLELCCSDRGCTYAFDDGAWFLTEREALDHCGLDPLEASSGGPGPEDAAGGEPRLVAPGTGGAGGLPGGSGGVREAGGDRTAPEESAPDPLPGGGESAGASEGDAASGGACWGSPVSCGARTTGSSCNQDYAGCHWEESYCGGAAYSCGYFSSASNCNAQGGCSWSYYYNDCRGGAGQCHQQPGSGRCYQQLGCYWVQGGCFGSAGSCASRSGPSSCNGVAGCYWQ